MKKKILICDYENVLECDYSLTIESLKKALDNRFLEYEIEICAYQDQAVLIEKLQGVSGLITGFLEIGEEILAKAPDLKAISVSGVGYSNIDCEAAKRHGVTVCHIEEYCTQEVAEHTFALITALNRKLKHYDFEIQTKGVWDFQSAQVDRPLNKQILGIFGYGKIGKRVAQIARAYGMTVLAVDPYADKEAAANQGVTITTKEELLKSAHVITNHMNLTKENTHYFCRETFEKMENMPIFINVGRGGCVKEEDLAEALNKGLIRAAGLDVLEAENPDLTTCKLLHRDNVILTPHSAFYSIDSFAALQTISGANLGYFLANKPDKIHSVVV